MPIILSNYRGQNWLITPAALAVNEPPPRRFDKRDGCWSLTGWSDANIQSNSVQQWLHETVSFPIPEDSLSAALNYAIDHYSIPRPPDYGSLAFSVDQWTPFASLSSIFDEGTSDNAGFAVDVWRPTSFTEVGDAITGQLVGNIFNGIDVDVAVRDTDAWITRISVQHIPCSADCVFVPGPSRTRATACSAGAGSGAREGLPVLIGDVGRLPTNALTCRSGELRIARRFVFGPGVEVAIDVPLWRKRTAAD